MIKMPHTLLDRYATEVCNLTRDIELAGLCDGRILITSDSPVGRGVIARAVHGCSARAAAAFVLVDCEGMPAAWLDERIFGVASETGGARDAGGAIAAAAGGTLFLNGMDALADPLQARLLRFIETGALKGADTDRHQAGPDVRLVAGASRSLFDRVLDGAFREDLFYRLNLIHVVVPPLHDDESEIPRMVGALLSGFPVPFTTAPSRAEAPATAMPSRRAARSQRAG
jgi:DNA-binding NtrC family response regulator